MNTKQITIKFYSIIFLLIVTACGTSKEQEAATMVVQTSAARETGTAAVEQAVSDALTKAAPTPTHTQTPTLTPTATPTLSPTPEFTATPEVQPFFTEEFENDLNNWSSFIVDGSGYGGPVLSSRQTGDVVAIKGNALRFNNDKKWQYVYSVYEPFEYEDVRLDARLENKGSNNNNISLICRYTEGVGWYEFNIANSGIYDILFAKVNPNGAISYGLIFSGGSNKVKQGLAVNEYTAICQENSLFLYINGSLEREEKVPDFSLESGKIGISVSSFLSLPVMVDVDWIKISSVGTDAASSSESPSSLDESIELTPAPGEQDSYIEEFENDLTNWATFSVDTTHFFDTKFGVPQMGDLWITGKEPERAGLSVKVENGFLKFENNRTESTYAIYEPFEYEAVRIDALFENKGNDYNLSGLICHYSEDVGWYELSITPTNGYLLQFAKITGSGGINYYPVPIDSDDFGSKFEVYKPGTNEITAICQGNRIVGYVNGSLVFDTQISNANFLLESGKVGLAVASHKHLPVQVDFDWVKINSTESNADGKQYITEDFDSDLENWAAFREEYTHDRVNWFLLSGGKTIQPVESMQVEDGFLKFDNQKMELNYAIYEPFEYEEVRIDARFENKGSNDTYVNLICNYSEDEGWYEIALSPSGTWYIGFAKVKANDTVTHVKYHPKGRMSGTSDKIAAGEGFNEFTAICQGNKITLYINGSHEIDVEVTDLWLDPGKVGVAVRSWSSLPAKIDLDWVRISQP